MTMERERRRRRSKKIMARTDNDEAMGEGIIKEGIVQNGIAAKLESERGCGIVQNGSTNTDGGISQNGVPNDEDGLVTEGQLTHHLKVVGGGIVGQQNGGPVENGIVPNGAGQGASDRVSSGISSKASSSTTTTTTSERACSWLSRHCLLNSQCGLGVAVAALMQDHDFTPSLKDWDDDEVAVFFEVLIDSSEPRVPQEESEADFELRRRDIATEHRAAFRRFTASPFCLKEKHGSADRLVRQGKYRQAYHEYSDAIFAAEVTMSRGDSSAAADLTMEHYSEVDEGGRPKMVSPKEVFLDLKIKQVECLHCDQQYRKSSVYSNYAIYWMRSVAVNGMVGFLASFYPEKYSLLQIWLGESEVAMGNFRRAIDACSAAISGYCSLRDIVTMDRSVFNVRQTFFEKLMEHYESEESEEDSNGDAQGYCGGGGGRSGAKIVVSETRQKGVEDGKFIVNDLDSALRIAKDNDVIFLEPGTFSAKNKNGTSDNSGRKKKKAVFEIRKAVTLIGSGTGRTVISGSLIKWGKGQVTFKRLKLEVGIDIDSDDDVYLMEGSTVMEECVVESPVNTCIFVISPQSADHEAVRTRLEMRHCVLDGLENCRRLICFQGPYPSVTIDSCYVSDLYSFLTVIAPEEISRGSVSVTNSVLYDVQDGLKMVVHHGSTVDVKVIGCQMDIVQYDQGSPSHAFSLTGGSCEVRNNLISSGHLDAVGLSLHSLRLAEVHMNLIETRSDLQQPRALSLGEGIVLSENSRTRVSGTEVVGMRVGFHISNQFDEANEIEIQDCGAKYCSVGLYVEKKSSPASAPATSTTPPDQAPPPLPPMLPPPSPETSTLDLSLLQTHFDTCHYGMLSEDFRARVDVRSCSFDDIGRPVLLSRINPFRVTLTSNEYKRTVEFSEELEGEAICAKMFLYFATHENLAHRMALDLKKFIQITSGKEEKLFFERYHLFRSVKTCADAE